MYIHIDVIEYNVHHFNWIHITDFRLHKVYKNGLKSVKNKWNNWKETSLQKTTTILDPILGTSTEVLP
jgi:hypothetical protein